MSRTFVKKIPFLILAPYLLGLSPVDSSFDEYSVGLGAGQYATYDCSGVAHPNSIADAGVNITHKFESPFRIGLSASVASMNNKTVLIPYPDLALDFKYFSIGTTGVRIGSENDFYGELAMLDQVPFFTGRGFIRMGIGMKSFERTRIWLGVNTFPYSKTGAAGQIDFPISANQFIFINGRYGNSGGVAEPGYSIGTRVRIP